MHKNIIKYLFIIAYTFSFLDCLSQDTELRSAFIWPMNLKPELAGNFAEPRGRHFHAGLDIRTYGEMKVIKSIADGHVARISVSPWGYGHCIYIDHPNGYTSVYAHINRYNPEIQKFIRKIQYENKSFAIDTCISKDLFPVKKGEIIAYSGNTGQSGGPHLHFEIRETENQIAVNTMQNIYKFQDNIAPTLSHIILYPLDFESTIDKKNEKKIFKLTKENNSYKIIGEKPKVSGRIGIGIAHIDRINNSQNTFGAQKTSLWVDKENIYNSSIEKISFLKQVNKNSMFDYQILRDHSLHAQKLFVEPNNDFDYYDNITNRGYIEINEKKDYKIELSVTDFNKNKSTAYFTLSGEEKIETSKTAANLNIINWDKDYIFLDNNLRVEIDKNSLFHDINFQIKKLKTSKYSDVYSIGDSDFYLKKKFTIAFYLSPEHEKYKDKIFVAGKEKKKIAYIKSKREQNFILAESRYFGEFYLEIDTIPPKITPINIKNGISLKGAKYIEIKIEDNFSGIKDYNMYINDTWVLAEYEPKQKRLRYTFDDKMPKSENYELRLIVSDNQDNESEYKAKFTY